MDWSVRQYTNALAQFGPRCTGNQQDIEHHLRHLFPPNTTKTISEPSVIMDSDGIVLLWFLPGLLNSSRQVAITLSEKSSH